MPRRYSKKYGRKRTYKKRRYTKRRKFMRNYKKADGYHTTKVVKNFFLRVDPTGAGLKEAFCAINWNANFVNLAAGGVWDTKYCICFDTEAGTVNPDDEVFKT